jgi:hypothetical protein
LTKNLKLHRFVVVLHHQVFKLDFGFGLLIVQAKVEVQLFGEILEVYEPSGFVSQIVNHEGLKVIESRSIQEGQNIVDLDRVATKRLRFGLKIEFALQEETVRETPSASPPFTTLPLFFTLFTCRGWHNPNKFKINSRHGSKNIPECGHTQQNLLHRKIVVALSHTICCL